MPFSELSENLAKRTGGRIMSMTPINLGIAYYGSLASSALRVMRMAMTEKICAESMPWMAELMRVIV